MIKYTLAGKNKRLRKKLFLGEYAELGFKVDLIFDAMSEQGRDEFLDQFIDEIENRQLTLCSVCEIDTFSGIIAAEKPYGSATDDDREFFQDWLANYPRVSTVVIHPLDDVNYGFL